MGLSSRGGLSQYGVLPHRLPPFFFHIASSKFPQRGGCLGGSSGSSAVKSYDRGLCNEQELESCETRIILGQC